MILFSAMRAKLYAFSLLIKHNKILIAFYPVTLRLLYVLSNKYEARLLPSKDLTLVMENQQGGFHMVSNGAYNVYRIVVIKEKHWSISVCRVVKLPQYQYLPLLSDVTKIHSKWLGEPLAILFVKDSSGHLFQYFKSV